MPEPQCTCAECAKSRGYISRITNEVTPVCVLTVETAKSEALNLHIGDECSQDHDHDKSKSCKLFFMCDDCGEEFEDENEAANCHAGYECNFCGWAHYKSTSYSPAEAAAECCATSCYDCGITGWPPFIENHECRSNHEDEDGHHGSMRAVAPWVARGISIDARDPDSGESFEHSWDIQPENHNVVQAAADYYLLEALSAGIVGTTNGKGEVNPRLVEHTSMRVIRNIAQSLMDALVAKWDPILVKYTHIAVGGELRHHSAIGSKVLSSNRKTAWSGWKLVFEAVGPEALADARDLFLEFSGGSFGGKPWADAADILYKRLKGKISKQLFLDRIFNAQHNGGCLMNKVQWAGDKAKYSHDVNVQLDAMPLSDLTYQVLPAHGVDPEPDYAALLAYASPNVRSLFEESYDVAAAVRWDLREFSTPLVRIRPGQTKTRSRRAEQAKANATQYALALVKKPKQIKESIQGYRAAIKNYQKYVEDEVEQNAAIVAKQAADKAAGVKPECNCGQDPCYYGTNYSTYYTNVVQEYKKQMRDLIRSLPRAEAKAQALLDTGWTPPATPSYAIWDDPPFYDEDESPVSDADNHCYECGMYYPDCPC